MTDKHDPGGTINMPAEAFEELLERAAEKGACCALHRLGLDGEDAAEDIRDPRSMLAGLRLVLRTTVQTTVRLITAGVLMALIAGIAIKLRLFDGE